MKKEIDVGKVFIDKDGAYRIYIGVTISRKVPFKHKEKVKVYYYPDEKRIEIIPLD